MHVSRRATIGACLPVCEMIAGSSHPGNEAGHSAEIDIVILGAATPVIDASAGRGREAAATGSPFAGRGSRASPHPVASRPPERGPGATRAARPTVSCRRQAD